jgi:uncharacterized membrane protein HdeD (DUF308 family)
MGQIAKEVQSVGRRMTLYGIIAIVAGIASIAAPLVTGLSIVVAVGIFVIAAGILRMIWAFGAGSFGSGLLAFAIGGLTLLCGLSLVSEPIFAFGFLTVLISLYLLADGVAEIAGAFRLAPESGRLWMIIGGVLSILLGIMMWQQYPLAGGWAIGVFLGIKLLSVGFSILMVGTGARSVAKGAQALAHK